MLFLLYQRGTDLPLQPYSSFMSVQHLFLLDLACMDISVTVCGSSREAVGRSDWWSSWPFKRGVGDGVCRGPTIHMARVSIILQKQKSRKKEAGLCCLFVSE